MTGTRHRTQSADKAQTVDILGHPEAQTGERSSSSANVSEVRSLYRYAPIQPSMRESLPALWIGRGGEAPPFLTAGHAQHHHGIVVERYL